MRSKEIKHGMLFNHTFHSALWFWNRGMKKRAVVQLFISYAINLVVYYVFQIVKHEMILKGRIQEPCGYCQGGTDPNVICDVCWYAMAPALKSPGCMEWGCPGPHNADGSLK